VSALEGRTAIVTGAARGIGADLARGLTAQGAKVVLLDMREDRGVALAAEFGEDRAAFRRCDVSAAAEVDAAFVFADTFLGRLDVLIHCAGLDKPGHEAEDIPLDAWELVMGVNARGAFLTNQQACRRMKSGGGAIINFASSAGIRGMGDRAAYSAAKGAVLGWTRAAALAWGKYDITVNAIAPTMNTEVARRYLESVTPEERARMDAERVRTTPMQGRLGEVTTDLLPLVLLLCGPGGRYMTGQTFAVDGGRTMLGT
jgi:NAD(P)-dependent dehydrogenase (short-subunit alcohol dehydrogenase family)